MNIHAFDANRMILFDRTGYLHERLNFSFARFRQNINDVEVRFDNCGAKGTQDYLCRISVELKTARATSISVVRAGNSKYDAFNLAVEAIESRVENHVIWRSWFNRVGPLFIPKLVRNRLFDQPKEQLLNESNVFRQRAPV